MEYKHYEMTWTRTEAMIQNQNILHENRLPARVNLVPAQKAGIYYRNKEESSMLQSLNGDYQFCYCDGDVLPEFYKKDYDDTNWDVIDVPSMWQYRGYGQCWYTNVEYPIPFNPPFISCENPVGYYRREFEIENGNGRKILHFAGVDNAFFVYMNGEYVGFSKGSRLPAEFDVTEVVHEGTNVLAVKVFTFSDATYLENQDMLMANGIFRDVYLLHVGEVSLWDYRVTNDLKSFTITAALDYHGEPGYALRMTLDGESVTIPAAETVSYTYQIENPKLWNAEQPNLYDLTIELLYGDETLEVHSKRIGMLHSYVKDDTFYVNGKPVYVKGINRHEYDCKNGRTITVGLIEKELRMIKDNNLNAVRCAHYTNHPAFYEVASEIGLYVMDEADLETHGCGVTWDQGLLSKDPEWYPAYLDRVHRMLECDKNEACIFMWSIGNECGRGINLKKCAEYIRAFDPTKEISQAQDDPFEPEYTNFRKDGYSSLDHMKLHGPEGLPVLLVEYAHAMGNGPGFLQGYWDHIYTNKQFIGGFVWEFKSHGFRRENEDGSTDYLYGGDWNEDYDWTNFVIDGMIMSDGTPKPVWYELGEVSAPVYTWYDEGVYVKNTNDFLDISYLNMKWEIREDFNVIAEGQMQMPALEPRDTMKLPLALEYEAKIPGAKYWLNLYFYDGDRKIAARQYELPGKEAPAYEPPAAPMQIAAEGEKLMVSGEGFTVAFDKGMLSYYEKGGEVLLNAPMRLNFFRAPIDNDGVLGVDYLREPLATWLKMLLHKMKFWLQNIKVQETESEIAITVTGRALAMSHYVGWDIEVTYRVHADGVVLVEYVGKPYGDMPDPLPRLGVEFTLDKDFDRVVWYGRGPRESYSDAKFAANYDCYEAKVEDLSTHFDVPQDNGNHEETLYARILNERGHGLCIVGSPDFAFSYHDYTQENLAEARHRSEMKKADHNYLYVDYKQRGLGSHTCGPVPEEPFELHPHTFKQVFVLTADGGQERALELVHMQYGSQSEALSETYEYKPRKPWEHEYADCSGK